MRPLVLAALFACVSAVPVPAAAEPCKPLEACPSDTALIQAAQGDSRALNGTKPAIQSESETVIYDKSGRVLYVSGAKTDSTSKAVAHDSEQLQPDVHAQQTLGHEVSAAVQNAVNTAEKQATSKINRSSVGGDIGKVSGAALLEGSGDGPNRAAALTPAEALDMAKKAEAGDRPSDAGRAYLQANDPAAAERSFEKALQTRPKDAAALAGLAEAQAQQGRGEEAVATARQALAADPHNALAGLIVGHADELARGGADLAKRLGQLDAGRFTAGATGGGVGGPASSGGDRGAVYAGGSGRGGPQPEAPLYDTALPLSSAQQLTLKALELHKAGDDQGALLALTQAIDQDPGNAGAFVVRAEIENALQAYPGALADARKAQTLAPQNAPLTARALRAEAYAELQTGDWTAALAAASRALELDGKSGLGYLYRAMAEDKLGRGDAAARDLAQAVTLDASLQPLALPLLKKYGMSNTPLTAARPDARMIRGGLIAGSLLLVLLGLLGTTAGRKAVTTAARAARSSWREGGRPGAAAELSAGDRLEGYRIVRELGRGGMGVVYEGLDETLQRRVAIKRMQAHQGADMERFLREARLVAQLKHPRVAEIYNVLDAGEPLLVFEFVEGRPLDAVLREARRLAPAQARRVVDDVCDALAYAHDRGIIHRDLKPANVMVGADGGCKVMDFGIAHQSTSGRTMTQTAVCGTPAYMAPEQGFGSVSRASDLFALGVMAYELLTGIRPFDGSDYAQAKLEARFTPVTELVPELPPGVNAFFARALAADPSRRFASAAEFRDAFARSFDGTPVPLS